ncbi:MAG: hypothetical protein AVDCRST_MAG02-1251, partial [uncultured Rubrobacteraceae bacterium]
GGLHRDHGRSRTRGARLDTRKKALDTVGRDEEARGARRGRL